MIGIDRAVHDCWTEEAGAADDEQVHVGDSSIAVTVLVPMYCLVGHSCIGRWLAFET